MLAKLTERQVDDDVVRAEVAGDVALVVDEQRAGGTLWRKTAVSAEVVNTRKGDPCPRLKAPNMFAALKT